MKKIFLLTIFSLFLFSPARVFAAGSFRTGDVFQAYNNTKQDTASWVDPLNNVDVQNIVEYRMVIENNGPDVIQNLNVRVDLSTSFGNRQVATAHATADNASELIDIATVMTNTSARIVYLPGHARVVDNNGERALPDTITTGGVSLGTLAVGGGAYMEVMFKANVVAEVVATPTPTLSPTSTPSPTSVPTPTPTTPTSPTTQPTPTGSPANPNFCGGTCGSNLNCQPGYFCYQGFCRIPSCQDSVDCICRGTTTPTPVAKTTPKTGNPLVLEFLGAGALSALGWKMRKFGNMFWK